MMSLTYVAGLSTPGGFWSDTVLGYGGHNAGDPIMQEHHLAHLKAFIIYNTTAFVASLLIIVLLLDRKLRERMVQSWELYSYIVIALVKLIGAYAAGSSRVKHITVNVVMAIAGVVLVYVVIHVMFFTLDHKDGSVSHNNNALLEKRRKRLLLFAILAATITYQAGLTPPGVCWQLNDDDKGQQAGDSILSTNNPYRYKSFFYCNTTSFMSSIALITLMVNPNLYRPAIKSYVLSVCMVADMFGLIGAYATGSSQHIGTSIYMFILVFIVVVLLLGAFMVHRQNQHNISS
ncbi:hypothetical protein ABZP36_020858 [Zizania latifolia]